MFLQMLCRDGFHHAGSSLLDPFMVEPADARDQRGHEVAHAPLSAAKMAMGLLASDLRLISHSQRDTV
jgi:hypothetical protein